MSAEPRRRRHAAPVTGADPFAVIGAAPVASRILVVCTGNICRSPVGERLLASRSAAAGLDGLAVESAGVRALTGRDMEPEARDIVLRNGGDPDGFVSRSVHDVRLADFDLVLTATESQRRAVVDLEPALLARTRTLLGFLGDGSDVVDPYRRSPDHYLAMERQIVPAIDAVVSSLQRQRHP